MAFGSRDHDVLLLDFGGVCLLNPVELHATTERLLLPPLPFLLVPTNWSLVHTPILPSQPQIKYLFLTIKGSAKALDHVGATRVAKCCAV